MGARVRNVVQQLEVFYLFVYLERSQCHLFSGALESKAISAQVSMSVFIISDLEFCEVLTLF